jgi:hypothetical protein
MAKFRVSGTGKGLVLDSTDVMTFLDYPTISIDEFSNDTTLADDSATALCTEHAIKSYVDAEVPDDITDIPAAGNWKVFYSNGSAVITELALGTAGQLLQSNGASAAPSFVDPADVESEKSGSESISNASASVSVVFGTAFSDATYGISIAMENVTDDDPLAFGMIVTAKATTGFTVELSGVTDSANYDLNWQCRDYS